MLNLSREALKRWKGFDQAIDRWLEERHELIVLLSDFASRRDFSESNAQLPAKIQGFRSLLIDYISAGHFEFFHRLIEEGREFHDDKAVELGGKLLKVIEPSTRKALDFDEKYDKFPGAAELADDLSDLAEELASRFVAEDQMISILHDAHIAEKAG